MSEKLLKALDSVEKHYEAHERARKALRIGFVELAKARRSSSSIVKPLEAVVSGTASKTVEIGSWTLVESHCRNDGDDDDDDDDGKKKSSSTSKISQGMKDVAGALPSTETRAAAAAFSTALEALIEAAGAKTVLLTLDEDISTISL